MEHFTWGLYYQLDMLDLPFVQLKINTVPCLHRPDRAQAGVGAYKPSQELKEPPSLPPALQLPR